MRIADILNDFFLSLLYLLGQCLLPEDLGYEMRLEET